MTDPHWEQYRFEIWLMQHRMFVEWIAKSILSGKLPQTKVIDRCVGVFDNVTWTRVRTTYVDTGRAVPSQAKAIS